MGYSNVEKYLNDESSTKINGFPENLTLSPPQSPLPFSMHNHDINISSIRNSKKHKKTGTTSISSNLQNPLQTQQIFNI